MSEQEILAKLALLRDNLDKLELIPQTTLEEFNSDFRNLDSALHRLQTSIQVLIDVGSYVCAVRGLGAPSSSREILVLLQDHGLLPPDSVTRFGAIFGFRNRVVHLYERIDPAIVYRVVTERRGDLKQLCDFLLSAMQPRP
ncbi:MAG: DUF86 domain-containing protein [Deltaproteobacteria bacterium]|nr:DUF86 domain-containing protein [Deltaproteobacteria bacterium]